MPTAIVTLGPPGAMASESVSVGPLQVFISFYPLITGPEDPPVAGLVSTYITEWPDPTSAEDLTGLIRDAALSVLGDLFTAEIGPDPETVNLVIVGFADVAPPA